MVGEGASRGRGSDVSSVASTLARGTGTSSKANVAAAFSYSGARPRGSIFARDGAGLGMKLN